MSDLNPLFQVLAERAVLENMEEIARLKAENEKLKEEMKKKDIESRTIRITGEATCAKRLPDRMGESEQSCGHPIYA